MSIQTEPYEPISAETAPEHLINSCDDVSDGRRALACVGDWVRCDRDRPAAGSWDRYEGKVGRVVTINTDDAEIGVKFTAGTDKSATWFGADELVVIDRPCGTPNIRTSAERKAVV